MKGHGTFGERRALSDGGRSRCGCTCCRTENALRGTIRVPVDLPKAAVERPATLRVIAVWPTAIILGWRIFGRSRAIWAGQRRR
jgi:hypothetical protein